MEKDVFLRNLSRSMDEMVDYSYEYCPTIDVDSLRLCSSEEYGVCLSMGSKRDGLLMCPLRYDGTLDLRFMELNQCLLFED